MFVAGFIGSPSMNFVEAKLARATASRGQPRRPQAARRRAGRSRPLPPRRVRRPEVILGIRPEDFEDASIESDIPADRRIKVTVDLTEPLGSEVLVHFGTEATAVVSAPPKRTRRRRRHPSRRRRRRDDRLIARVSPKSRIALGQQVELAVDTTRLYFFDPETARRSTLALDGAGGEPGENRRCRMSVADDQRQRHDDRRGHHLAPGELEGVATHPVKERSPAAPCTCSATG